MKAVRLYEYGGPEKLTFEEDVAEPHPDGDSVLIQTVAASINPIDWKVRSGARQRDMPLTLPAILGKDVSGVIVARGVNVRNFNVGDRVLAFANATYAERVVVNAAVVTHLPDGVPLEDAAALPLAALTGYQLVRDAAQVQKGQTVLVTGALGSVGRAAVHAALKLGAQVIAGVRITGLDEAQSLGGADVVAIDDEAAIARLPPLDAVADTVGGAVAARLLARIKSGGRFGFASVLPEGAAELNPAVTITRVFAQPDPSKVREYADDVRDGLFHLPIGRRLSLRDAAAGHALGERGGVGKILLLTADL